MALIQEPWYREECTRGLNIQGYTIYSAGGRERIRECILARNMSLWALPGFTCRDLVAFLVRYFENWAEKSLVACSAYLPYDSDDPPHQEGWRNSCDIVRKKISTYLWGATPMRIMLHGVAPTAKIAERP